MKSFENLLGCLRLPDIQPLTLNRPFLISLNPQPHLTIMANYELTPELNARFTEYVSKYTALVLHTVDPEAPFDTAFATRATRELYRVAGLQPPKHIFIGTWIECIREARRINTTVYQTLDPNASPVVDVSGAISWGQFAGAAASFARYFVDEMQVEQLREKADTITNVVLASGPTLLYNEAAFISYHPTSIDEDPLDPSQYVCKWGQQPGLHGWVEGDPAVLVDFCVAQKRGK